MTGLAALGWVGLLTALAMLLFLGAAPVFAVRLAAQLYPPGSKKRLELPAEMAWVEQRDGTIRQWQWLGGVLATALCDGPLERRRVRRVVRRALSCSEIDEDFDGATISPRTYPASDLPQARRARRKGALRPFPQPPSLPATTFARRDNPALPALTPEVLARLDRVFDRRKHRRA